MTYVKKELLEIELFDHLNISYLTSMQTNELCQIELLN